MNISKDISSDIYKNAFWIWLHLASTILLNALIYTSLRFLEFSPNFSLSISIIGVTISLIVTNIRFPNPSLAKKRFSWTIKVIYQVYAFLMLPISTQSLFLFVVWLGILVSIWSVFLAGLFAPSFKTILDEIRTKRNQDLNNAIPPSNKGPYPTHSKPSQYQGFSETFNLSNLAYVNFQIVIENEMKRQNLSVNRVALLTGVDRSRIRSLRSGEEEPSTEEAISLLKAFGISEEELENYRYASNETE